MSDKQTTIQELKDLVEKFKVERHWHKHHTPKNLAISIAIEAAELLEHFQWYEKSNESDKEIASELADVIIYCLSFAEVAGIDVSEAVKNKMHEVAKRYPKEAFNPEADLTEYYNIKKQRRGK